MSKFIAGAKKRSKPSTPRWSPHSYQKKAVRFLLERGAGALFLDPGLGKTSITLAALKMLKAEGVLRGALVVAPLRVAVSTWPAELKKWADFEGLSMGILHGPNKAAVLEEDHDIYVVNYEGLEWLFRAIKVSKTKQVLTDIGLLLLSKVNVLVWDELSRMKHTNTKRFKLVKPWLKKFDRRWGLTGSPAPNGLMDLFGCCYVLDEGNALGPYITHYRATYFTPIDASGYTWKLKKGAEDLIYERLKPLALRMAADDYLELPKLVSHVIKFDLPPDARRIYDELETELMTILPDEGDGTVVSAAHVAASQSKCRQVCSGALYLPDIDPVTGEKNGRKAPWAYIHDEKMAAFKDLVEELNGQQLLVAYEFRSDLERLQKAYPGVPHIGGGVGIARGKELEAAWNRRELPMLFVHPAGVSHGLNLQEGDACHVCWFTVTWDLEFYEQLIRRLLRQGNKASHVFAYHLVAKDSVEESVMYSIRSKDRTQQALLRALKQKARV